MAEKKEAAPVIDEDDQFAEDLVYVMSTLKGRRMVWHLLGKCGKGAQPMVVGNPDATAFNCGKLDVACMIEAVADPDLYVQMTKEAKDKLYDRHDDTTTSGNGDNPFREFDTSSTNTTS